MRGGAEGRWRGARGFPVLVKDSYLYSRTSGAVLEASSQREALELNLERPPVAVWRMGEGERGRGHRFR